MQYEVVSVVQIPGTSGMRKALVRGTMTVECFVGGDGRIEAPRNGRYRLISEELLIGQLPAEPGVYTVALPEVTSVPEEAPADVALKGRKARS